MSRIATITTVLTLAFVPAAFAKPLDLRSPDQQVAHRAAMTNVYAEDLRSPDAADVVTPASPAHHVTVADDGGLSTWAFLAIIAGALAACALLIVMLRRAFAVGRPVGA